MKLFTVPNLFTLGNLLCGCLAIVFAFDGNLVWSAYLVGIAAVLDFLDGFVARALNQHSPIGKDLDSLADMVTFGVVPGIVMFKLLGLAVAFEFPVSDAVANHSWGVECETWVKFIPFSAFLITLFSALRLAKFNNDTRQSDSFIGVPTPANSILICSFPLILRFSNIWTLDWPSNIGGKTSFEYAGEMFRGYMQQPFFITENFANNVHKSDVSFFHLLLINPWFLLGVVIVMSYLLIAEFPLFALKFKSFGWKGNEIRWIFLGLCLLMLATLKFLAIPLTIVLYVLMSIVNNLTKPKSTT